MTAKLSNDEMERRFQLAMKPFVSETMAQLTARIDQLEGKYPQPDGRRPAKIAGLMILEMTSWLVEGVAEAQLARADGDYDAFEKQLKQMMTRKLEVLLGQRYGPSIQREGINLFVPSSAESSSSVASKVTPRRTARKPRAAIEKRMKS
jgi:hypothetical protein